MDDKADGRLMRELEELRKRIAECEQSEAVHREAEERIRESENKYRILFENATDAIYLIDPDTQRILDCNSKASKIIGYTIKQLKAMTVRELHPDEEQDIVLKIFKKVVERGSLSGIVGVNQLRKDKKLVPVEINAATVEIGEKRYCLSIVRDITEHKKAEETLRYEKNKVISILDSMEDGVYIAGPQYDIEYLNPVLKKEFGAVRGRKCYMYFHDRESACPWCKNKELLAGKSVRWEWHSEKNNKIYDLIDTPLKNPDGSISKLEIFRDITNRKRVEEALIKSGKAFRDLVDNSLIGVYKINLSGDILYVNEALSRIAGYNSPEQMMEEHVRAKYKNKEDREKLITLLTEHGSVNGFETELLARDGQPVRILLSAVLAENEISGMIMDITDRKNTEEKLVMSEKGWEKTFDTIPDLILVIDNQHKVLKANKAIVEKLGVKREDLIGRSCHDIMHGTETPPSHCPHSKTLEDGKEHIREIYEEKFKGFYMVSSSPVFNSEGRMLGIVEVSRDITERKRMEEQLRTAAMTDELTGLFNRRGFFTLSEKHCKMANRTGRRMSLLYLDLDNMKTINDTLGHKAGDQALMDTAKILKESFRESDIIARIGGDEFAVLLTEHSEPDIEHIVSASIKKNLDIHKRQGLQNYELSFSMGIVYYDPRHPCSIDNLLTKADSLMYDAKRNHQSDKALTSSTNDKETESRIYKRFRTGNNCWAEMNGYGKVRIKDISIGGICLKTSEYLNTRTICNINVHSETGPILSKGMVVWSYLIGTKTDKEISLPYYETGLKFIEINDKAKNSLEKYISVLSG